MFLPIIIACLTMGLAKLIFCLRFKVNFVLGSISAMQLLIIAWAFIAEEIGWRGYWESLLRKQGINKGVVPFITRIIWCLWHYHYFLQNGVQVPILWFFISCIVESYIYSFLMDCTDKNLISAMIYHFFYNLAIHMFLISPVDNYDNIVPYILLVILALYYKSAPSKYERFWNYICC